MTNKERQILNLIAKKPDISQNELADILNISRSSVSVHIVNLMKKGFIKGRGYIISENAFVMVIGGANMDILGFSNNDIILYDSNPGKLLLNPGGVGRNIAENLARMGLSVNLITALGKDIFAGQITEECTDIGINCKDFYIDPHAMTPSYLAIMDNKGELSLALSHMDTIENLPLAHIEKNMSKIQASKIIVLDTNLTEDMLHYIANKAKPPVFVDTVSVTKSKRILKSLPYIHTLKINHYEAEGITGIEVFNDDTAKKCADYFFQKGVKRVAITKGAEGSYFITPNGTFFTKPEKKVPVNATGAGDAFMAGLVHCAFHGKHEDYTIKFAQTAAILALQSKETVNPEISYNKIIDAMKKIS